MPRAHFVLLTLCFSVFCVAQGPNCTEDISLISGEGCASPCCYQDPPNSGHYVFSHSAVEKIDIRNNGANILSLSFPNLASVEKTIRISYNQPGSIQSISFPALRTAGSLEIRNNPGLVTVDLPRLRSIANDEQDASFRIQSNENLLSLNTPTLDSVLSTGNGHALIQIRYNSLLETIDFPLLRTVEVTDDYGEAYIIIGENDLLQSLHMDHLQRLVSGGESISYLVLSDMPNLNEISFSQFNEFLPVDGEYNFNELTIIDCPSLTEFVFPSLERVTLLQLGTLAGNEKGMFPSLSELEYLWLWRTCSSPDDTFKLYICSEQSIMDLYIYDNGTCGPSGYLLYSENLDNAAECDASEICQSFIPDVTDCKCGSPGLCTVGSN